MKVRIQIEIDDNQLVRDYILNDENIEDEDQMSGLLTGMIRSLQRYNKEDAKF